MPRIFAFVAICVAVAIIVVFVGQYFVINEKTLIVLYAATIVAISLLFPIKFGRLDKDKADLVYYSLAIVAGAMFFVSKEGERIKLDIATNIERVNLNLADDKKELLTAQLRLKSFNYTIGNRKFILQQLSNQVESELKFRDKTRDANCKCAFQMTLPSGPYGLPECLTPLSLDTSRTSLDRLLERGTIYDRYQIDAMSDLCEHQTASLKAMRKMRDSTPDQAEADVHLAEMLNLSGDIALGLDRVDAKLAIAFLQIPEADLTDARTKLLNDKAQSGRHLAADEAELARLQNESQQAIMKIKTGVGLYASLFAERYWPYVLIALLGLKIARVQYISGVRNA